MRVSTEAGKSSTCYDDIYVKRFAKSTEIKINMLNPINEKKVESKVESTL